MRSIRLWCAVLAVVLAGATRLAAQERGYVVIVNESNALTSLSVEELGRLFMKRTVRWTTGQAVTVLDLAGQSPVRAEFSRDVHGKSAAEIKAYWQTVIFSARGTPPTEVPSESAVVEYVRGNSGAVAYVSTSTPLGQGVRAVRVRS